MYDISLLLRTELPAWPGDFTFEKEPIKSIEGNSHCNTARLSMSSHYGTHVDAPYHFEPEGLTLERLDLNPFVGPVLVHEVDTPRLIQPRHLPDLAGVERILFKTPNSRFVADRVFHPDYTAVGLEAAQVLVQAGVKLVGIDYFSIEAYKAEGHPVHHEFCSHGVIILEGVDLRQVPPGVFELIALPLKIECGDGSPVRAILRDL